jgi:hypothetical protein
MMKLRFWALAAAVLSGVIWPAFAAEISVFPGDGTLAAAVASATSGDTLVLQDGTYSGAVTVDKSLIIRPVNSGTFSVLTGNITVGADGIRVTLRRLRFISDVRINQAADVRLLENYFSSGSIAIWGSIGPASGAPSLLIVGNTLANGNIEETGGLVNTGVYVGGNTVLSGHIRISSATWIVGNEVHINGWSGIYATGSLARILANRVHFDVPTTSGYAAIQARSPYAVIQNNIIEGKAGNGQDSWYGILCTGSGYANITNNVIRDKPLGTVTTPHPLYSSSSFSRVSGNIVTDFVNAPNPIDIISADSDVSHNLCFNNSGDCPAGNGNLNADPQFVDLVDYRLAPNSPAIDAGPPAYEFADLDRSRNDMGAHGGPYSIGQYDVQRDPANLAPFVYPLVNSAGGGILEAQALGVARLR